MAHNSTDNDALEVLDFLRGDGPPKKKKRKKKKKDMAMNKEEQRVEEEGMDFKPGMPSVKVTGTN